MPNHYPEHLLFKMDSDHFGVLRQSEKNSKIKPPLNCGWNLFMRKAFEIGEQNIL